MSNYYKEEEDCPRCSGSGEGYHENEVCLACGGTGVMVAVYDEEYDE